MERIHTTDEAFHGEENESAHLLNSTDTESQVEVHLPTDLGACHKEILALRERLRLSQQLKRSYTLDIRNDATKRPRFEMEGDDASVENFWHRTGWLVGLLIIQSISSFILKAFDSVVLQHEVIVLFLTMLVGAGGNAGSQSTVIIIRALALGHLDPKKKDGAARKYVWWQLCVGIQLALILMVVCAIRVWLFATPFLEVLALSVAMFTIVLTAVLVGTLLPLALFSCNIDPAHAAPAIQVLMDIVGVFLTCSVSFLFINALAPLILPQAGPGSMMQHHAGHSGGHLHGGHGAPPR
uniref:SLC41A/MgtE integral membrane domain-containing protein n=1 Tax=Chromera velia CCMP2878 TaxID=1169474 RepID=A0A0G4I7Z3_9ALVE|mmetsp:Transcript_44291/g.87418  ORF Transcript_44291/g.87418 Transcript_44291/m.87418 type:complete len:296 (+) Transcript_44291:230-1117(+)|eukprot:Cvel_11811.t1-p1 / transcript=Cvel_11811.t1 / gene=Cvel_11811 / organism=Chromera_velia_CCMP2878 / gene_product=Magnesium transporter MgtE, putative / transcript_product=Magnesium transporter MgtE, putative / location=Cvel_scaffold751:64662-67351(+) / protein_length=295 / sequence_SO=supercontig / SO=protein_coding / is_pseudo=false